jgi:hypothetical protein
VTIWFGTTQATLLGGSAHWIVQIVHLMLGVASIGLGHMAGARQRKASA